MKGGAVYVGEFHDDKPSGQGILTYATGGQYAGEFLDGHFIKGRATFIAENGNVYIGDFRDNKFDGQGTYTYADGNKYVGQFRANTFEGRGTFTYADGRQYVGEFRKDKFEGQGTETYPNGDRYVGEFHDDKPNGQGTLTNATGRRYVGEFRDGKPNGQGIRTYTDGTKQVGLFRDGSYAGPSTNASPALRTSEIRPATNAVPVPEGAATTFEVVLRKQNGVLLVPVLINDKIPLDFVLDSGAADVSIPADVVLTLIRTGTLTEADFMGTNSYVLADGSKVPSQAFRIRSLKVGDQTLKNVVGSVASVNGSLLLGQSFLTRFKSWSIDNVRQVLVLR